MSTTKLCIISCSEYVGRSQKPNKLKSAFISLNSASSSLSFAGKFVDFASFGRIHYAASFGVSVPVSVKVHASSTIGVPDDELGASYNAVVGANDLLIVGPGVLGRIVAEKWQREHPGSQIYGQTLTTDHHDELKKVGIIPSLKGNQVTDKFPNVIFCAPPSRNPDYPGEVREAILNWSGEGSFLFTSSSAPIDCNDNGSCDENTPVVPLGRNPKTDTLLNVEKLVLEAGGCVARLAGLYKVDRGAHTYWLKKGTADTRPDHILNLIHYEDAASLSITILKKKFRSESFLAVIITLYPGRK